MGNLTKSHRHPFLKIPYDGWYEVYTINTASASVPVGIAPTTKANKIIKTYEQTSEDLTKTFYSFLCYPHANNTNVYDIGFDNNAAGENLRKEAGNEYEKIILVGGKIKCQKSSHSASRTAKPKS